MLIMVFKIIPELIMFLQLIDKIFYIGYFKKVAGSEFLEVTYIRLTACLSGGICSFGAAHAGKHGRQREGI